MVFNISRVSYWVLTSHQPHRVLSGRDISRARDIMMMMLMVLVVVVMMTMGSVTKLTQVIEDLLLVVLRVVSSSAEDVVVFGRQPPFEHREEEHVQLALRDVSVAHGLVPEVTDVEDHAARAARPLLDLAHLPHALVDGEESHLRAVRAVLRPHVLERPQHLP